MWGLLFLSLLGWSRSVPLHEFKMSVTELIYHPEDHHFEVKIYLFTDDLTEVLTGNPSAPLPTRVQVEQYLQQHFTLLVGGQPQPLQLQGIRQRADQVLVQLSSPQGTIAPQQLEVRNQLLTSRFKDQTNMVYLIVPGKHKKTEALDQQRWQVFFTL